jgi:Polyketide cyclase / dehydrase and lipid transport
MFKKILIVLGGLIAAFLIVVAMQPSGYAIARSQTIAAAPNVVFAQVNNLHHWDAWSPWAKLDQAAKNSFEGPQDGTGAVFRWAGNDQIGEGSMTIIESKPGELVRIRLDFLKPMAGTSESQFTFAKDGNKTVVTWSMTGKNDFIGKAFCLFINMDRMLGHQFEQGLSNLKRVVETPAKP